MTKEESEVKAAQERSRKERGGRQRQRKEKLKPPTKIVIRHLPPTMTEEEFLKQIDPLPEHDFYYFVAADWSLGYDATCRAYITLKNYEDVFLFRDRFDGYVFVDSKGSEYPGIVEFAPFQGLLKNKSRRCDNKVNSIEEESHYQLFLQKLEEDREAAAKGSETKLEFTLDRKKDEKITSTPLLQYLANKKEKRREEAKRRTEEKKRQRLEEKDKRRQQQPQQNVTKIVLAAHDRRDGDKTTGAICKDSDRGGAGNYGQDERKDSTSTRSKRRTERSQRRREEYERRKKERELQEREQREKGNAGGRSEKEGSVKLENVSSEKRFQEKQPDEAKPSKDAKKYSEKRERNRNRRDKEKEARDKGGARDKQRQELPTTTARGNKPTNTEVEETKLVDEKLDTTKLTEKQAELSESVLSFIRSAAVVKEFIPRHKQQQQSEQEDNVNRTKITSEAKEFIPKHKQVDTADTLKEVQEKMEKISVTSGEDGRKVDMAKQTQQQQQLEVEYKHNEGGNGYEDESKQTQKQREERRIRNKDRPSIAIYQPKARLRLSEEKDPISPGKDVRSNPTSDCESVKKDEQRSKKVSRYSERRSERRSSNKDKQQMTSSHEAVDIEPVSIGSNEGERHELRKSKSLESGNNEEKKSKVTPSKERKNSEN